jgi:large subunit ribosomal protein L18
MTNYLLLNFMNSVKREKRIRRHKRVRSVVHGTLARPRLAVFRSLSHTYAQLIDDESGKTLAQASSLEVKTKLPKTDKSVEVGKLIAAKAGKVNVSEVVFDRGGNRYHGRIKALADAAREAGLKF